MKKLLLIICFTMVFSNDLTGDTVVIDAFRDNTIYQDNVGNSNGSGDFIFAGQNGGGSPRRALIAFDLASIPDNAVIESVSLELFMSQSGAGDTNVSLHRLTSDWGEGSSDAAGGEGGGTAAELGDATWINNFFDDSLWDEAGGDFDPSPSATSVIGSVGSYTWSSASLVDDVQNWLTGDHSNFGWMIIGDETAAGTSKRFNSRSNMANSPSLTIRFNVIPEPTSAALLTVMPAFLFLRRCRKD